MRNRTTQIFLSHNLIRHRLHDVRTSHEHIARVFHHEDEVGHCRRIDRTAGARPHDKAQLRHDAAGEHIALEHFGIAAERSHALLNARAAAVVQADDRRADLHRHVHHLADLLRVAFGETPAKHGKVLRKDEHQPPVDRAAARHHAIAGNDGVLHPEVGAVVLDIHVEFLERPLVEQHVQSFPRGQPPLGMLRVDPLLSAAHPCGLTAGFKFCQM